MKLFSGLTHTAAVLNTLIHLLALHNSAAVKADPDCSPVSTGPTGDSAPGIGIEIEWRNLKFGSQKCKDSDLSDLKRSTVKGHPKSTKQEVDKYWALTVDRTKNKGQLNGEYVLDGSQIKLGKGILAQVAARVAKDFADWKPSVESNNNKIVVNSDTKCKDWTIISPADTTTMDAVDWDPQITVPLPLAAVSSWFKSAISQEDSKILPMTPQRANLIWVNPRFFSNIHSHKITPKSVSPDLLGFLSLVLTFAKSPKVLDEMQSPKVFSSLMPRNDFTTMYGLVKDEVQGDLYSLVQQLSCYTNDKSDPEKAEFDGDWCDLQTQDPKKKYKLDNEVFTIFGTCKDLKDSDPECTVKHWIETIDQGQTPDSLTYLDETLDSSLGGFGNKMETAYGNAKVKAPLFELRSLKEISMPSFREWAKEAEEQIIALHKSVGGGQGAKQRRGDDSDADGPVCDNSPTKPNLPKASAAHDTRPAKPTYAIHLSENSVTVGDEMNDQDKAKKAMQDVFKQMQDLCPDDGPKCDSSKSAEIKDITTIIGKEIEKETLQFTVDDSHYESKKDRDKMLSSILASWTKAAFNDTNCQDIDHVEDLPAEECTSSNPDNFKRGQILSIGELERRDAEFSGLPSKAPALNSAKFGKRQGGFYSPDQGLQPCTRQGRICMAPNHISAIYGSKGDPYANYMDVSVTFTIKPEDELAGFLCELAKEFVEEASLLLEEFVAPEIIEEFAFDAICGAIEDATGGG